MEKVHRTLEVHRHMFPRQEKEKEKERERERERYVQGEEIGKLCEKHAKKKK